MTITTTTRRKTAS